MMVADFYSKPLQGKLFRIFRNMILNLGDKMTNLLQEASNNELSNNKTNQSELHNNNTIQSELRNNNSQECVVENTKNDQKVRKNKMNNKVPDTRTDTTRDIVGKKSPRLMEKIRSLANTYLRTLV